MQPTEIIVYRNPLEYAFWNGGLSPIFVVIVFAGFAFAIGAVLAEKLFFRFAPFSLRQRIGFYNVQYIQYAGGGLCAALTFYFLWVRLV
jgi:hypothetical protein